MWHGVSALGVRRLADRRSARGRFCMRAEILLMMGGNMVRCFLCDSGWGRAPDGFAHEEIVGTLGRKEQRVKRPLAHTHVTGSLSRRLAQTRNSGHFVCIRRANSSIPK